MPDLMDLSHDMRLRDHFSIDQKRRTNRHRQSAPHFHSYFEIYYLLEGECRYFLLDSVYNLKRGHFLIVPPGAYHMCTYEGKMNSDRYALYFDDQKISDRILSFPIFRQDPEKHLYHYRIRQDHEQELLSMLHLLLVYFESNNDQSCYMINHLLPAFLLHLMLNSIPVPENENDGTYSTLEATARYIASNYASPITLEDAAKTAGFTPSYFSRKFKEMVGIGFHDYLTHIRLKNSAELLRSSSLSIQEISVRCGFASSNYFGDVFRSAYGVSPRSYRKKEDVTLKY